MSFSDLLFFTAAFLTFLIIFSVYFFIIKKK